MSHWKGWGTSCAGVAVSVCSQLIDWMAAREHLGAWASLETAPMGAPTASRRSTEVCTRSFVEQMDPACGAEVLRRDRLKKDVSFCRSMKQKGKKIPCDANNWDFAVCAPHGSAPSSPSCQVLSVAGFVPWVKTRLVFDLSALGAGGWTPLQRCCWAHPLTCPDTLQMIQSLFFANPTTLQKSGFCLRLCSI